MGARLRGANGAPQAGASGISSTTFPVHPARRVRFVEKSSREDVFMRREVGLLLAGVWLALEGLVRLASLSFRYDDLVMGALAVAAGVLMIIKR